MDGETNFATMHIVTNDEGHVIKEKVREELKEHRIQHVTLELEAETEHCNNESCVIEPQSAECHHHHHHH